MNDRGPANAEGGPAELRVILLAPSRRDAAAGQAILAGVEVACHTVDDVNVLCAEARAGAGAIVLPEEALARGRGAGVAALLAEQPSWSDLPVLVLAAGGQPPSKPLRALLELGAVHVLRRPLEVSVFVTAVRSALRDRRRQYQVRNHLADQARQATALIEADRRKDEFLAMLAHELRNPLAPIRTGLQILKAADGNSADAAETRHMLDRQVQHLARLVDDLLDVSRITRGKVELRRAHVDLADVLDRAAEAARPMIDIRGHQLTVTRPGRPVWVSGDLTRLTQVVGNLLNNAAKYSDPGGRIDLTLEARGAEAAVRVRDSGAGIPADMLPRVFDLFTQADRTLDRAQGGLGIGLTLVKSLIEMHGGSVAAASDGPGRGSEFVVRLPAMGDVPRAGPEADAADASACPPARILVVDDNVDAANSLSLLLKFSGHEVRAVHHGAQVLDAAREMRPDIVILDIGLPGMDGYQVARALRQQEYGRLVLLIALTGYGQEEDRQKAVEAGFDHHLTKPCDPSDLRPLLANHRQPVVVRG